MANPAYRLGYDPVDLNPALRIETNERLSALQFDALNKRLDRLEAMLLRLERRMWLIVYGIAAAVLAQTIQSLLHGV